MLWVCIYIKILCVMVRTVVLSIVETIKSFMSFYVWTLLQAESILCIIVMLKKCWNFKLGSQFLDICIWAWTSQSSNINGIWGPHLDKQKSAAITVWVEKNRNLVGFSFNHLPYSAFYVLWQDTELKIIPPLLVGWFHNFDLRWY